MEVHEAADKFVFAGGSTAGTQTGFDGGGTAIVELEALQVSGQSSRHFFQQTDFDFGGEVVAVHQLFGIESNLFGNFRMAMSEGGNIDTAGEVDVFVAVDVAQDAAVAAFKGDREKSHLTGKTTIVFGGTVMQSLALGARKRRRDDFGIHIEIDLIGSGIVFAHFFDSFILVES